MRKRGIFLIVMAVLLVVGAVVWLAPRNPPEPVYDGRPLSYWLQGMSFAGASTNHPNYVEALDAMSAAGTNGTPTLLRLLRAKDSPLKLKFFSLLQRQHIFKVHFVPADVLNFEAVMALEREPFFKSTLPDLIEIYDENISPASQRAILDMVMLLGPDAKDATPALLRGLTNRDYFVRNGAVNALRMVHADPKLAVPELIKSLQDPFPANRMDAAYALGSYRTNASAAVVPLLQMLNDKKALSNTSRYPAQVRAGVEFALNAIDRDAAAKAGVKIEEEH
jgi:hypothetical protein